MKIFCFASKSITNIWAGIGAGLWAVSETSESDMKARVKKSKRMKVGSAGLLYCTETHSFTTPFLVYSSPDENDRVTNVWGGEWRLPFHIHPLGTPDKQVHKDEAMKNWPILAASQQASVSAAMNITGTTVFVPTEISSQDWEIILNALIAKA